MKSNLRRGIRDTVDNLTVQAERATLVARRKYPHAYTPRPDRGGRERSARLTTAARTAAETVAQRRPTGDQQTMLS